MSEWRPPRGLKPFAGIIKVSVATVASGDYQCPAETAMKARGLKPVMHAARGPQESLEDFAFGPFMADLDEEEGVQRGRYPSRRRPMHDGLRAWTANAHAMYQRAFPVGGEAPLLPATIPWVYHRRLRRPDRRGATEYEISAWGRHLLSSDGRIRELRLLAHRSDKHRTDGERSIAALVAAEGGPGPLPDLVRVVQVGLSDGHIRPLFEGDRGAALALFEEHGRERLEEAVDGTEFRPGTACTKCSFITVCPALKPATGLLGINDRPQPRRSWSPTNGRRYVVCPARDHLRRLNLPVEREIENSPAAERGRAVHDFLERRHRDEPERRCAPDIPPDWVNPKYTLSDEDQLLALQLLRYHAAVCPLRHAQPSSVQVERTLAYHDRAADIIVITKPDLLYRDQNSWVWRELKTRNREKRRSADLIDGNPQLALAVLLVGRGDLGGSRTRARIELEVLHPGGADLEIIDPFTPSVREAARAVEQ
ncbi:hypothetical protein Aple_095440 [Acrocarpospora pleiomorpha]|uniref:PD-(D/E)XK endonuclease-like domain-containing protein n=1 Tax=Acrocarpospora pleiomorpha TaxID=90975 RepID=A0A5M3XZW1_9ACTN|nr:PD-(D/E)XK nuclease family protein [Acrocarpospora pleiomorpha]GES26645.1 hypothetical protein Aple_095440 [Acrocarpospora pleiomorpha]